MKLNTGKVAFAIEFDNGDKEYIYFNPNDPDLMIRLKGFEERTQKQIEEIEDIELLGDGTPADLSKLDIFEKMQNILKGELDCAFGGEVSKVAFKHCSPFAIVGNKFFVVQFIEALVPEIEKEINKTKVEIKDKMSKHIDKYKK